MAISRRQEARALSADERELVERSRPPVPRSLTDIQLAALVKRMRTRRDKARTVAERQRREMRGKTRARGAKPSRDDEGSQLKVTVLSTALRRLETETARRQRVKAKTSLVASAKKALALKQKAARPAPKKKAASSKRASGAGLRGKERIVVESHVPRSARGRVRKQTARVQAKRDSRPR
jgi:hypothetical protein